MEINIKIEGLENVVSNLQSIQGASKWVVRNAITSALSKARTEADRAIRERYGVRQASVLASISRPYVNGLFGLIHSSGKRLLTQDFTNVRDTGTEGVRIPFIKNKPAVYPHAFMHRKDGPVLERISQYRYPLKAVSPPASVPEMLESKAEVKPKVEEALKTELYSEMDRLMRFVLTTGQVPKSKWQK
jgi:hypothetical protein